MNPSIVPILLLLTLTCCSDEPKAQHPSAPPSATATIPIPRETTQPQVVPPPAPPERKPDFDIKLQHIQEQVEWVNRRIGH